MKQRRLGNVVTGVVGVLLLAVAGWGLWHHQFIADWLQAKQFEPDAAIVELANRTTMTDRGQMLFYASQPQLQPAEQFNKSCAEVEKGSAVLGCYVDRRIYIYNVTHEELAGIAEVTAAHEMLHAAYDRLSSGERRDVNNLLNQAALSLRADQRFTERLNAYEFTNSDEKHNELHSIIGTEIATLDPALEKHYARYFDQRSEVVALHSQYEDVFKRYTAQAQELADQLDAMATDINAQTSRYEQSASQLQTDISEFNRRSSVVGSFRTRAEFDVARNELLRRQDALSTERQQIIDRRAEYDRMVSQYNDVALHLTDLSSSLDSRLAPTPEVQ